MATSLTYAVFGLDLPSANGDDTLPSPIPVTYVVCTAGTVAWRFADPDYTKRAEPDEILAALGAQ